MIGRLWIPMLALLAPLAVSAEEIRKVDPIVVTPTKVDTPQSQLGSTVSVIAAEEIRTFNYSQLQEALRPVPGIEIQRFGGLGKGATLRIRGSDPTQVQVLVDGLRVKSPASGFTDLADLSLDAIDRIEIVRGPQSGLYGADAIGGVVNIITKKGEGAPRVTLFVEGGSFTTVREAVNAQGAWGRFNFNVSASRYDTRGHLREFNNDDSNQTVVAGRLGYDFPWKGELSLTGRYSRLNADLPVDNPGPPIVFDPNAHQQSEVGLYTLAYRQPIFDWWQVSARFGQWWNRVNFQDPPPPPGDDPTLPFSFATPDSLARTYRREAELVNSFTLAPWNVLTVGAEHRADGGTINGTFAFMTPQVQEFSKSFNTVSVFGQDEIKLFERLFLTGSVRWEDSDEFGSSVTGRVALAFVIKETGTKIRGVWGQGFRTPTINDLLFPGFGNTALKPEKSDGYEVGVDQRLWENRVRLGATYFHTDFRELIQSVFDPTAPFSFRPVNVGRARTEGVEAYLEVEPLDWLLAYVNYTYLSAVNKETGRELPNRARNTWNTGIVVTPHERLRLFMQAHVASNQFVSTFSERNPGYYRIDTGGTLRVLGRVGILDRLELTARIENLTDQRYAELAGFPQPGFNALVGLRATFD